MMNYSPDFSIVFDNWPVLMRGLWVTIQLWLPSIALGLIGGSSNLLHRHQSDKVPGCRQPGAFDVTGAKVADRRCVVSFRICEPLNEVLKSLRKPGSTASRRPIPSLARTNPKLGPDKPKFIPDWTTW